ncbi:hypothetical protein A8H38_09025 [Burkholderia thailandensis]|nr:hypothetical protein A8H38_09025 [Burkholderia thailandensis]
MRETFIEAGAPRDGGAAMPRDTAYVGPARMYGRRRRVRSRAGREGRACVRAGPDRVPARRGGLRRAGVRCGESGCACDCRVRDDGAGHGRGLGGPRASRPAARRARNRDACERQPANSPFSARYSRR